MPPVMLLHEREAFQAKRFREMGSILVNHDPDQIIGKPVKVDLDVAGRKGRAEIEFDKDPESDRILQKVKGGSLRGVSVRYSPTEYVKLQEKEQWTSPEGRTFKGPLIVVTRWEPKEISLTPIPADAAVGVGRQMEDGNMPEWLRSILKGRGLITDETPDDEAQKVAEKFLAEKGRSDPPEPSGAPASTPPAPQPPAPAAAPAPEPASGEGGRSGREAARAEHQRAQDLFEVAERCRHPEKAREWIEKGVSPEAARKEALDLLAAERPPLKAIGSVEVDARDKRRDAYSQHLLRHCVPHIDSKDRARVEKLLGLVDRDCGIPADLPFSEMVRRLLVEEGDHAARSYSRDQLFGALMAACRASSYQMGTSDLPYLLENTAKKSLAAAFEETPVTFTQWCGTLDVPDFKTASRVKLSEAQNFDLTPEHMPVPEGFVSDARETYQAFTYSKRFGISRQAMINDDLGGITRIPALYGQAARRTQNKLVYDVFLANPTMAEDGKALFADDHPSGDNLGTVGAPSLTTLTEAFKLMRLQKGAAGVAVLNILPRFMLLPAAHQATVWQLLYGNFVPTAASGVVPEYLQALTPIVEPLLDANSVTAWYLAAGPAAIDTVAAVYLRGQRSPSIQRYEGTSILGVEWIAYFDFGAKVLEHRGLFKNAGA